MRYCFELPLDHPDECPIVDLHPCGGGAGTWERLPDSPIFVVHAAVMRTGKVVLWAGTAEVGDPLESRVWDPVTNTLTTQLFGEDLVLRRSDVLARRTPARRRRRSGRFA